MVKVLYYVEGRSQPFVERMEACPPRIGEKVELLTNQAFQDQKTFYTVNDVTTLLAAWTSGGEVKKVLLRQIALQGEVIMGDQGEVENP